MSAAWRRVAKSLAPSFVVRAWTTLRAHLLERRDRRRSPEEVFTEIYATNRWGGAPGELNSGAGSDDAITAPYVAMLRDRADADRFSERRLVDLGCGDFRVGAQLQTLCGHYTGVDIVKRVVERNTALYGGPKTNFVHLNIIDDPLPDGDICTIRQVLQHLSNAQIATVLAKLRKYEAVFITEHYPTSDVGVIPNVDKTHGGGIRLFRNSGVYLTEPPFSLPRHALELLLEVPHAVAKGPLHGQKDEGVVRTYLYRPGLAATG